MCRFKSSFCYNLIIYYERRFKNTIFCQQNTSYSIQFLFMFFFKIYKYNHHFKTTVCAIISTFVMTRHTQAGFYSFRSVFFFHFFDISVYKNQILCQNYMNLVQFDLYTIDFLFFRFIAKTVIIFIFYNEFQFI